MNSGNSGSSHAFTIIMIFVVVIAALAFFGRSWIELNDGATTVRDKTGDLVDAENEPVDGPGFIDIKSVRIEDKGTHLLFKMELEDPIPDNLAMTQEATWAFCLDVTGDGSIDKLITATFAFEDWTFKLSDYTEFDQKSLRSSEVDENVIILEVDKEDLDSVEEFEWSAYTELNDSADLNQAVTTYDTVPEDGFPLGNDSLRFPK